MMTPIVRIQAVLCRVKPILRCNTSQTINLIHSIMWGRAMRLANCKLTWIAKCHCTLLKMLHSLHLSKLLCCHETIEVWALIPGACQVHMVLNQHRPLQSPRKSGYRTWKKDFRNTNLTWSRSKMNIWLKNLRILALSLQLRNRATAGTIHWEWWSQDKCPKDKDFVMKNKEVKTIKS